MARKCDSAGLTFVLKRNAEKSLSKYSLTLITVKQLTSKSQMFHCEKVFVTTFTIASVKEA